MLYIVTGGSGSGKSEFAENLAVQRYQAKQEKGKLYYVATMYPYDQECLDRIEKHRYMRKDRGFTTKECYLGLNRLKAGRDDVLLLECMSNLLANEMYQQGGGLCIPEANGKEMAWYEERLKESIVQPVLRLAEEVSDLLVVTNEVFSDSILYEPETMRYISLLGKINTLLSNEADQVVEVVCSIPVYVKRQKGEG
ncbi:MAG: bifunctional adenosylcobinamide kinase/adenosylcobinamide-phosphate guanylyltransferase [Clostridiaceae bacterium]|nr:bifunctional adenosylcobinamide kinase/adenosylcobinamide-phosphate guanylyltransferase [Clostridiaceae bacterium]